MRTGSAEGASHPQGRVSSRGRAEEVSYMPSQQEGEAVLSTLNQESPGLLRKPEGQRASRAEVRVRAPRLASSLRRDFGAPVRTVSPPQRSG
jgi:hypothetical protein